MLEVVDAEIAYGLVAAVAGVSMRVGDGEVVAMVGHNGAGKTTLLRAIAGLQPMRGGRISVNGQDMSGGKAHLIARHLAFVPQGRNIFGDLTIGDNLRVARDAATDGAMSGADVLELFPALAGRQGERAGSLSGGQQQMLALSLALTRKPRLVMMDEPSTGLAPLLVQSLFALVARLNRELGTAFLIIDQNVERLVDVAARTYVLKGGKVVFDGASSELKSANLWSYF